MSATHYMDGTPKAPKLGAMCTEPDANHRLCGGWWCICECHDDWEVGESSHVGQHGEHEWHQVGPCVYCKPCGTRLYQGEVATGDSKQAMVAFFETIHSGTRNDWQRMRTHVLAARALPTKDSDDGEPTP